MEQSKKFGIGLVLLLLKQLHDGGFRILSKHENRYMIMKSGIIRKMSGYYQDLIDTHIFHNTIILVTIIQILEK